MNYLKISIPNPCQADWNKMQPNNTGRHCSLCEKTVVDFTKMNETEIKNYFLENVSKKTCGHFHKGQLRLSKNKIQTYFTKLYTDAHINIKHQLLRSVVLLALGFALTIVGCNNPTTGEIIEDSETLTGDTIAPLPIDTTRLDTLNKKT